MSSFNFFGRRVAVEEKKQLLSSPLSSDPIKKYKAEESVEGSRMGIANPCT